jgi:GNAT superfamily N-acetyltransferase
MIFETLNESNERGELLLVLHGMCHYHVRRDGQLTIREIIVQRGHQGHGIGRGMLRRLEAAALDAGATSIFAKCPAELAANGWYAAMGFTLDGTETTRSGRTLNLWRLRLSGPAAVTPTTGE